ncbi:MAG TPA: helix-turn-helix domain-containing protein [Candidatus Didemnitutus sp.]|nr:helix-turn-helix domain-containing protein [Candidatus Didemnitutus sp.]
MVTSKLKALHAYEQKVDALRKEIEHMRHELTGLPSKFGFGSMAAFIKELRRAEKGGGGKVGRRRRAKITPEIKQKVKALVAAKKTGAAIAAQLGISLPSVQNIKRELGLVRKRA